jgi:hypothetical protein
MAAALGCTAPGKHPLSPKRRQGAEAVGERHPGKLVAGGKPRRDFQLRVGLPLGAKGALSVEWW